MVKNTIHHFNTTIITMPIEFYTNNYNKGQVRTTKFQLKTTQQIFKISYNITTNQIHYNTTKIQQMQCQENFNFSKFHLWIQQLHWPINTFYFYMSHLRLCFQHLHSVLFTTWRWTITRQRHSAIYATTTLSATATLTPQLRAINQFQSTHIHLQLAATTICSISIIVPHTNFVSTLHYN